MTQTPPFTSKTYPPRLQAGRLLVRRRVLDDLRRLWARRRILLIQAQAGQGKTVIAAQLLNDAGLSFSWYQLGPEDGDPVFFIPSLLSALTTALPGFRSPLLSEMLAKREIRPQDAPRYARILAEDLQRSLRGDFCLVFDDLHLLEGNPLTLRFLEVLLREGSGLHFLLLSRRPPELDLHPIRQSELLTVGNRDLALTRSEIAELFGEILGQPLSPRELNDIHRATEGWMAGVLILAEALRHTSDGGPRRWEALPPLSREELFGYFQKEIFTGLPAQLRRSLMKLALLETIPLPLAGVLAEVPDVRRFVGHLEKKNFFIRHLDDAGEEFSFHHLFRDFLREMGRAELTPQERQEIYSRAGAWHLEAGRPEEALGYFLEGGDFDAAQKLIAAVGLDLLAGNRLITLGKAIGRIPEPIVLEHPWLSYLLGAVYIETAPPQARRFLERAREIFAGRHDPFGELLASVHLIMFHLTTDARFKDGAPLLTRAEELYRALEEKLSESSRIWISQVLASGFGFFEGDLRKMEEFSSFSLQMAERCGLENFIAAAHTIRCNRALFLGRWDLNRKEIEASLEASFNPQTSPFFRLLLWFARVNLLEREGDFFNYDYQKSELRSALEHDLIAQTVIAPWILAWDIEHAIARADLQEAASLIEQGLLAGGAGDTPHLRSIYLQYFAYLRALQGSPEEALAAAVQSCALRREAGGEWFRMANETILGGVHALLGRGKEAEELLRQALERSDRMGEEHFRASAQAFLALLQLRGGRGAGEYLQEMLGAMRRNGYRHLMGHFPPLFAELLQGAVDGGVEEEFAQKLALDVSGMVLRQGRPPLPRIEIRSLGRLELELGGTVLGGHELSAAQRELLGLLLARPGFQMRQEEMQCLLWPESPPEKSRSSFDTLLSRLRALMDARFRPHSTKEYLTLSRGMLRLENCRVDARDFAEGVRQGLAHARKQELWQAANAFRSAFRLWGGAFHPGGSEEIVEFKEELEQLHIEGALAWSAILVRFGQNEEAVQVLSRALKRDRTHDQLVRELYRLQMKSGHPANAAKTLRDYRKALEQEGYTPAEVEEILESFWT